MEGQRKNAFTCPSMRVSVAPQRAQPLTASMGLLSDDAGGVDFHVVVIEAAGLVDLDDGDAAENLIAVLFKVDVVALKRVRPGR